MGSLEKKDLDRAASEKQLEDYLDVELDTENRSPKIKKEAGESAAIAADMIIKSNLTTLNMDGENSSGSEEGPLEQFKKRQA